MRTILYAAGVGLLLLSLVVLAPLPATAQYSDAAKAGPPPVLQIIREEVKPGRGAAHEKVEAGWPAAFSKAKIKNYWLGGTPIAGPSEAWFLVPYASIGEMEEINKQIGGNKALTAEITRLSAQDGELINHVRSIVLNYNPDLSYRPNFNVGEYRYFMVDVMRLKLGHYEQFETVRKAINAAHEKAGLDEHMVVYGAAAGAPAGTIYIFQPLKSLKEMDGFGKSHGKGSAYYDAWGDEGRKAATAVAANDLVFSERNIFTINPGMSYVSEQVMAAAPDFWKPKAVVATKESPAAAKPVAKKEPATKK